jgi:hypothetical protein
VKGHLPHIFTKLNALSRMEAVTVASQRGLVQLQRLNLWLLRQRPADRRLDLLPNSTPFKRTALDQFLGTPKVGPFGQ